MASLRKKPNSPYFFACFRLPNGKRTQVSTKLTERKAAQKFADELEAGADALLVQTQARKLVSRLSSLAGGSGVVHKSAKVFFEDWYSRKASETASTTAVKYQSVAKAFVGFLGSRADTDLGTVSQEDVRKYRDQAAKTSTPQTANNKLKVLRVAFEEAVREGLIAENPAKKIPVLKMKWSGARKAFSVETIAKIYEKANEEWRGIILFGLYTGQRLKDICLLIGQNINLVDHTLRLTSAKTERVVILPLSKAVMVWINTNHPNLKEDDPLFPHAHATVSRVGRVGSLSEEFHRLKVEAGVAKARSHKRTGKGRSAKRASSELPFHSLRHTTTTLLKTAGVPSAVVMDIIGHETKAISDNYTHIDLTNKREAIELLPNPFAEIPPSSRIEEKPYEITPSLRKILPILKPESLPKRIKDALERERTSRTPL